MKKIMFFSALALSLMNTAIADADINFSGTVHETPDCTVNNSQPINVDFGTVDVDTIDGTQNSVNINYTFECPSLPSDISKWIYGFALTGTGASFDSNALSTSMSDLGISIKADGVTIAPTGKSTITSLTPNASNPLPVLTATLVKNSGSDLSTGSFTATASLSMAYY